MDFLLLYSLPGLIGCIAILKVLCDLLTISLYHIATYYLLCLLAVMQENFEKRRFL